VLEWKGFFGEGAGPSDSNILRSGTKSQKGSSERERELGLVEKKRVPGPQVIARKGDQRKHFH